MSKHFPILTQARKGTNYKLLGARVGITAIILVFVISLLGMNHSVASAAGTTYYVNNAVACSESGPGSIALPFCTISKGGEVAAAGDTVRVVAGTYAETVTIATKNGADGNPITFQGSPGVTVTGVVPGFGSAFAVSSSSYIVIDGFKITNTPYKGIYVDSSNHITISNNEVSNAGVTSATHPYEQGIYLKNTTYSTITGNTTHHNTCIGIRLINNSNYNLISDNVSYANFSVVETDAAGIELTGASNNTIINNITYGNEDSGINIYVNSSGLASSNNLIIGNLSYENGDHGIDHNNSPYNTVIGNTVHGNGTVGINFEGEVGTGSHHATVINNISVGNGFTPPTGSFGGNLRVDSPSIAGTVLDYNLFNRESASVQIIWNNTSYLTRAAFRTAEPTQEIHGLEGNPLFVDPVASVLRANGVPYQSTGEVGDYHLTGGSPAIDSANSAAPSHPSTDIEGHARVDDPGTANTGAGPSVYDDRGAYEFVPSGSDVLPTVTTQAATSLTHNTAIGNGNVTNLGVPNPTQHGVVWSMSANPTILDSKTTDGPVSATGAFTSNITGLAANTLYHVRAYASNAAGTAYGDDVTFTTLTATGNTGFFFANATITSPGVTNPNNGWTSNNLWATFNSADTAEYGFPALGIPANSTIDGIEVTIEGQRNGTGTPNRNFTAALWNTSALNPDAYSTSKPATLTNDDTTQTLGGPADKWGTTWTVADFADATFKIRVGASGTSGDADLDAIAVKVYYTLPLPKATTTTVNCGAGTPVVAYGSGISCVATVVRSSGSFSPTGNVSWTTNGGGTFATSPCTLSGSGGTATCSVTYTPNAVGTGSHLISAAYAGDTNFLASSGNQTVTVNPKAISVAAVAASKIYGAVDPALTYTADPLLGSDAFTGALARAIGETVAPYAINQGTLTAGLNYTITFTPANFTITPKAASVTPNVASKVYGAVDPALTGTLTGFMPADNVTAVYSRVAGETVLGGPYTITAVLSPTGVLSNYTLTYNTANFTITPKALTISGVVANNKIYDGNNTATLSGTAALVGVLGGDTVNVGGTPAAAFANANVGTGKPVSVIGYTVDNSNYSVSQPTGLTADITAKGITVTANNQSKVVSDPDPAFTFTASGFVSPDTFVTNPTCTVSDPHALPGTYPIVCAGAVVGSNYTLNPYVDGTLTVNEVSTDANLDVHIGGNLQEQYVVHPGVSMRDNYAVNAGPVKLISTNDVPVMAAERVIYKVNNVDTSFSEMMALPASQVDKIYWLPWYNNKSADTQLRIANVSDTDAIVHVTIGGTEMTGSPYTLTPGASKRLSYEAIDKGPVKIESNVNIVAAERVIYKVNNVDTSFTEMLALSNKELDSTYWLPWYNNKSLDTQLRIANVSDTDATVQVTIGGVEMGASFTLTPGASKRLSYEAIDKGPVKIESTVPVVAAARVMYKVDNINTSFSELMALPNKQLDSTYWLPWYNSKSSDTQLRIANVSATTATVHVTIGGVEMTDSPFTLTPGASKRLTYLSIDKGPVKIESNVDIVVAERVIYKVNNVNTSFSELMGLPSGGLNSTYWLPWYNNLDLNTQFKIWGAKVISEFQSLAT